MVTPLQIDSYFRDLWGQFDPLVTAQLLPLVTSNCYKPKIYVGLDSTSQNVAADGYASCGISITPGSLIYGFYMGLPLSSSNPTYSAWAMQLTDVARGRKISTDPLSQNFLSSNLGGTGQELNYPALLPAPYPVVGKGRFEVEVWNQLASAQVIVPLIGVFELVEGVQESKSPVGGRPKAAVVPVPVTVAPTAAPPPGMVAVQMRAPTWNNLCWALRNGAVDASQFDPAELMKLQWACTQLGYAGSCFPPQDVMAWLDYHRRNKSLPHITVTDAEIAALAHAPDLTGVDCPTSWKLSGMTGYVPRRR